MDMRGAFLFGTELIVLLFFISLRATSALFHRGMRRALAFR